MKIQNNPSSDIELKIPLSRPFVRLPRLSEELARLVESFAEHPVTLREVVNVLRGRAYTMLLILLALPFCKHVGTTGLAFVHKMQQE